jgi:hypothetical protein
MAKAAWIKDVLPQLFEPYIPAVFKMFALFNEKTLFDSLFVLMSAFRFNSTVFSKALKLVADSLIIIFCS